jgi:hypothetical protein
MWIPLGVREGQSLCTSTTRNRGWAAGTHHCSCQLGHAGYVWSELDYRIVVCRVTRRGHIECVCDVTWNCMSLCNCSHQFCKNIPVSFDFITTWNQGVFLCSPCIFFVGFRLYFFKHIFTKQIPLATQSKSWVFSRSLAGIAGSNPAEGMDVFLLLVLCFVR